MRKELEQKIHEFAEQMYMAGYGDRCLLTDEECLADQKRQYEKGLNDAWECIKKIGKMNVNTLNTVFDLPNYIGVSLFTTLLTKYSASEAIAKIKEYEEKQKQTDDEIKVGDGVISTFGKHGYVTGIDKDELYVLYPNGEVGHSSTNTYVKDGRYFSRMAEILKQMEGEND